MYRHLFGVYCFSAWFDILFAMAGKFGLHNHVMRTLTAYGCGGLLTWART